MLHAPTPASGALRDAHAAPTTSTAFCACTGSSSSVVQLNIFANDQHKSSVRLPEGKKPEAGTSDRDVTAPPEAPVVPDPSS